MPTVFDRAFERTVGIEGGYSNNPADSGGETMFGITAATAREYGYTQAMRDMPLAVAKAIYRSRFWDAMKLDQIAQVCESIAVELFDTGVNCGTGVAALFLQECLNAFNRQGKLYPDIAADGAIGPGTISALRAFYATRSQQGQTVLLRALNCLQGARYIELTQKRKKDEEFAFGWILNRVEL